MTRERIELALFPIGILAILLVVTVILPGAPTT